MNMIDSTDSVKLSFYDAFDHFNSWMFCDSI